VRVILRQPLAVVLLAAALCSGPAWAIDPNKSLGECSVDAWRSRDGVPGVVRALAQTPEGYLWIGTNAGLVRYGGGPAMAVASPDRALMRATDVMGLLVAHDGALWITPGRGDPVCVRPLGAGVVAAGDGRRGVDPANGELSDCFSAGQTLGPNAHIIDLQQDAAGAIWLATGDGLFRWGDQRLTQVHAAVALPFDKILAIHPDRQGRLWLGTSAGLFVERAGVIIRHQDSATGSDLGAVTAFYEGPGGRLWVARERGLLRIDGQDSTVFDARAGFPAVRAGQLIEDRDGNVWFASRRGLHRFIPGRGFDSFARADGLPEDDVTCVFEDREGSLWVGTRGWGIAQFTDRTLDGRAGPPSLRDRWINSLAEDDTGALWVGTRSGATQWRGERAGGAARERTFTVADGLPSNNVLTVHPGRAGDIWIGTEAGLARWRSRPGEADGRIDRPVEFSAAASALHRDGQGSLWIGAADGLARLQATGEGFRVDHLPAQPGLELNEIRAIEHDDRGALWLSAGGKLLTLDGTNRVVTPADPKVAAIGKIRSLYREDDGTLWIGTGDGLVRNRGGRWTTFGAAQGLVPEDLYQIITDDRGYVWASTTAGIVRISKTSLSDVADGRRSRIDLLAFPASDQRREVGAVRARQPGVWRGHDGRLWFATSRGVVSLDPARLRVNTLPPVVLIEQVLVDGRPARRGTTNAFPPGAGLLEFHFSSVTLIEPQRALHRYRLEGFDRTWIEAGTRRAAYYTNIAPGHYRFRVQGSNADGVWNETGDVVALTLAPHLYQTWWFYVLCAAAALALVFSFHRMHVAQVHSRYAATFAERNRVARELHDSLLQGMAAALLHMKGLRKRFAPTAPPQRPEAVAGALERIESLIGNNMEETRRFVWDLRDGAADVIPLAPALERLVHEIARQRSSLDRDRDRAIKLRIDPSAARATLAQHPRRELLRIAQEAVNNAITHADASQIEVRLARAGDKLTLAVSDDGRGFDPGQAAGATAGHFGLLGLRERAASIGALVVQSAPGQGTTVEVTIDLLERDPHPELPESNEHD
jgi:ligand-binding sensor domain-containing protein/signal transduction histidine kinase